jgi:predicted transcriptional regulator
MVRKHFVTAAVAVSAVSFASSAFALPKVGVKPKTFVVSDPDDRNYQFDRLAAGGATLVMYVDKSGADQNAHLLERLQRMRATDATLRTVKFVPIIDVAKYNGWPARGFAKKALREESKRKGVTIYADWEAAGRSVLAAESGRSNLFLLDKKGNLVWASSGQLAPVQEDDLINRIRTVAV